MQAFLEMRLVKLVAGFFRRRGSPSIYQEMADASDRSSTADFTRALKDQDEADGIHSATGYETKKPPLP